MHRVRPGGRMGPNLLRIVLAAARGHVDSFPWSFRALSCRHAVHAAAAQSHFTGLDI